MYRTNILERSHWAAVDPGKVPHVCPPVWERKGISCSFCQTSFNFSAKAERFSRRCSNPVEIDANVRAAWLQAIAEHLTKLDAVIDKFN